MGLVNLKLMLRPLIEVENLLDEGMGLFELGMTQRDPVFFDRAVDCFGKGARLFLKYHERPYSKAWEERISDVLAAKETIYWIRGAHWSVEYRN